MVNKIALQCKTNLTCFAMQSDFEGSQGTSPPLHKTRGERLNLQVLSLISPNIGEHLAFSQKESAGKLCFLSIRSKEIQRFSHPVQKVRGDRLKGGPQSGI